MKKYLLLLAVTISLAIGFTACDNTGSKGGTGTMEITMTDAPANYDSVNVTINKVRVNKEEEAEVDGTESDEEAEENGWTTIMDQQMKINLLELTNGSQITLGSEELEAGEYSQIRLILGESNTVTVDGQTYDLQTPSAQQSGLKLNIDAEVEGSATYSLLIDFDVARSIVEKGNGGYLLKPVLRAVNLAETGSIAGNVQPADVNTNVFAVLEGDTVTSTMTAKSGSFEIIGLAPNDDYEVAFDPDSDQYTDSTQTDIEVEEGEETDLGTVNLE